MHLATILLAGTLVAGNGQASIPLNSPSVVATAGVPHFEVNLDMPPQDRWVHVAQHYRDHLIEHLDALIPALNSFYMESSKQWLTEVPFDDEYEAELAGMAKALNHPSVSTERLKWLNMLYEMDTPLFNPGCTGILWAMHNGTVIQGRNMDDFNYDPLNPNRTLSGLTFDVTLYRNARPHIKMTQLPGRVGVSHGIRFGHNSLGGYAIAQNTRKPNSWMTNLQAAKRGGKVFGLSVRRIMESTEDYETAVNWLSTGNFMAPHYFIVSGARPYQGVVLSIDRLGQRVEQTPVPYHILRDELNTVPENYIQRKNNWFLVQTNDDIDKAPQADFRRPFANHLLSTTTRDIVSEDHLMKFLHTTPILNPGTVVSTVMVPRSGYYKSVLPSDPPEITDGNAMDYKLFEQEFLQKYPITPYYSEAYPVINPAVPVSLTQESEPDVSQNRQPHHDILSLWKESEADESQNRQASHERRFLNRHRSLTDKHQIQTASSPADEVSFVQHYWKLEN
jgi:N-acylethanolamine-hydrolysing acid amidase